MFYQLLLSFLLTMGTISALAAPRANIDDLSQSLAEARAKQVKTVNYALEFAFQKGSKEYTGKVKMDLQLNSLKQPLNIDLAGNNFPVHLSIDGIQLKDIKTQKGSIEIPAQYLKEKLEITISFTNSFSKEGAGIQHIVGPEDQTEYIYTDFDPYQAHQLFPCFDQPDLKAHFTLTVSAPTDWKVIGNELPENEGVLGEGSISGTTHFKSTPLISTYLFFVGAGNFVEWKSQEGKIPLFVYSRKSLSKFVDADKLFSTIQKGIRFFQSYFGVDYPFSKFGIVFAPEFQWGGMENPGAIVIGLARNGFSKAASLIDSEEKRDLSDVGKRFVFSSRVAMPKLMGKKKFWNELLTPEKIPPSTLGSAVFEFHQPNYLSLSAQFETEFFARLKTIDWKQMMNSLVV